MRRVRWLPTHHTAYVESYVVALHCLVDEGFPSVEVQSRRERPDTAWGPWIPRIFGPGLWRAEGHCSASLTVAKRRAVDYARQLGLVRR